MTTQETIERLEKLYACERAIEWAKDQEDFGAIINNCDRGDWLFWLGGRILTSREIAIPKAEVAETVLHIFEKRYPDDDRPRKAIDAAKQYGRGDMAAADADAYAAAVAYADADYASAYAADAAADAADADAYAYDAAAAADAASAADAAADAADADAYAYDAAAARKESQRKSAEIFRSHFSIGYLEEKLKEATDDR